MQPSRTSAWRPGAVGRQQFENGDAAAGRLGGRFDRNQCAERPKGFALALAIGDGTHSASSHTFPPSFTPRDINAVYQLWGLDQRSSSINGRERESKWTPIMSPHQALRHQRPSLSPKQPVKFLIWAFFV